MVKILNLFGEHVEMIGRCPTFIVGGVIFLGRDGGCYQLIGDCPTAELSNNLSMIMEIVCILDAQCSSCWPYVTIVPGEMNFKFHLF